MPKHEGQRPDAPRPAGGRRPRRGPDPRGDRRPLDLVPLQGDDRAGRDHRVTAFDLRGHGYSDVPASGYTSADHAERRAGFDGRDRCITRARLVGHSFGGGRRGLHAAVIAPESGRSRWCSPTPTSRPLRHLEDLSRWGHWQAFQQEAAEAGVALSSEHWYDLGKFFDQVDAPRRRSPAPVPPGRGPAGDEAPAPARETTTCGDDTKAEAGLTVEKILASTQPTWRSTARARRS